MKNFDKIKIMTIDEEAEFLSNVVKCEMCPMFEFCNEDITFQECLEKFKQWLLSEVENDNK